MGHGAPQFPRLVAFGNLDRVKSALRERWPAVRALLEAALGVPRAGRQDFVAARSADPELRDAVMAMLVSEDGATLDADPTQCVDPAAAPMPATLEAQAVLGVAHPALVAQIDAVLQQDREIDATVQSEFLQMAATSVRTLAIENRPRGRLAVAQMTSTKGPELALFSTDELRAMADGQCPAPALVDFD